MIAKQNRQLDVRDIRHSDVSHMRVVCGDGGAIAEHTAQLKGRNVVDLLVNAAPQIFPRAPSKNYREYKWEDSLGFAEMAYWEMAS